MLLYRFLHYTQSAVGFYILVLLSLFFNLFRPLYPGRVNEVINDSLNDELAMEDPASSLRAGISGAWVEVWAAVGHINFNEAQ